MGSPDKFPRWADVSAPVVEPPEASKDAGFTPGQKPPAQWLNWLFFKIYQWVVFLFGAVGTGAYGDGRDGSATLDGVNTYPWATLTGGNKYTMTQTPCLQNLTIATGITLVGNTRQLFGTGTLTVLGTGHILYDGNNGGNGGVGSGGAGGAVYGDLVARGPLMTSQGGGNGGMAGVGANGTNVIFSGIPGGGVAGNGGAGSSLGGLGGVVASVNPENGAIGATVGALTGFAVGQVSGTVTLTGLEGGAGGGGGGGDGSNGGGGGGGGGGVGAISFPTIHLADSMRITALGGNGGSATTGNTGGGGGGVGGYIRLVCNQLQVDSGTMSSAANCAGGTGGLGHGTGVNGQNGLTNGFLDVTILGQAPSTVGGAHEERGNIVVAATDSSETATFLSAFSSAPPTGYTFGFTVVRTDAVPGVPTVRITATNLGSIVFTIDDNFTGLISWWAKGL